MKNRTASAAEDAIIGILLLFPEQIAPARKKLGLCEEDFFTEFGRRIFSHIVKFSDESGGFDWGMLAQSFSSDEMSRISALRSSRDGLENGEQILEKCVERLRRSHTKEKSLEDIINEKRNSRK